MIIASALEPPIWTSHARNVADPLAAHNRMIQRGDVLRCSAPRGQPWAMRSGESVANYG